MSDKIHFCCPECKSDLREETGSLHCKSCNTKFPVIDGIPSFCEGEIFYESRWIKPHRQGDDWLSRMQLRLDPKSSFFLRYLPTSGTLLDLGCGGGFDFFKKGRAVAGIDISTASLKASSSIYDVVARADATKIPFPDETLDAVVSWDFLGHIAFADKNKIVSEIWRLLKDKGKTIHYIEAAGENPFEVFGKRDQELYKKHFIEKDGHIGLETPSATLKRFQESGFKLKALRKCSFTGLRYPEEIIKRFDNEYRNRYSDLDYYVRICKWIEKHYFVDVVSKLAVALMEGILNPLTPVDRASGICVFFEKP